MTNKNPFTIAEMSGNHNQSLDKVLQIIDAAAQAGVHALKLRTYTADTITMKGVYTITDKKSLWYDRDLLKCTSIYPATPENSNLLTIQHLKQLFDCQVGLSDYALGIGVAIASIALGATVIEKHFCLSRAEGGVDSAFSMEPQKYELITCRKAKTDIKAGSALTWDLLL